MQIYNMQKVLIVFILGIKVLLDFVPNHTSDRHEWFQKSVKRIAPYTNYYIWKDPKYIKGKRVPPNNWVCTSILIAKILLPGYKKLDI